MLQEGQIFAKNYVIRRILHWEGGSSVYAAVDVHLSRFVAIKVIDGVSPHLRGSLLLEALAWAHLQSPHVVQVFDAGQEGDTLYLVMELLMGEELSRRLERGRVSMKTVLRVAQGVAEALESAHSAGLIHCDINPSNIFLAAHGDSESVKLFDFESAKPMDWSEDLPLPTRGYSSPEQFSASESIDYRSDLWSLAAVLFEALTGQLPFAGPHMAALMARVLFGEAPSPSTLVPGLPTALDEFFSRAFAKAPADRFQSAREMGEAFTSIVGPLAEAES